MASKQPGFKSNDYHVWGGMLEKFNRLNPQPKTALLGF